MHFLFFYVRLTPSAIDNRPTVNVGAISNILTYCICYISLQRQFIEVIVTHMVLDLL